MAFEKWCVVLTCCLIFPGMVQAQEIELELLMSGSMFGPGSPFSLDLIVTNTGTALNDAQLFVALTIGTGDFWFFPAWKHYPPDIDWDTVDVPASASDNWEILPMFSWPYGAGAFEGAMFIAAILHNGMLMSNLADVTFGWSETPQPTPTSPPGFVYISPGNFTMGSPESEPCRWIDGETLHQVTLTRGFYMMTMEVTRQMWADLRAAQPTLPDDPSLTTYSPTLNHPVQNNKWYEAVLFANLMSLRDGYTQCYYKDSGFTTPVNATNYTTGNFYCKFNTNGYRLPTEAEREYACRAGTTGPFSVDEPNYSSDNCKNCSPSPPLNVLESIAWWCENSDTGSGYMAHPVGTKLANPWGLYDMYGNVWEWCWDWIDNYPSGPVTNPTGPSTGLNRVCRGGCWGNGADHCRSATRFSFPPENHGSIVGFRLVRTAP